MRADGVTNVCGGSSALRRLLVFACLPAASVAVGGAGSGADASDARTPPPNILILVADDMGVDRIGVYDEHPDPGFTPVLDRLARQQGVWFRNAWAAPGCSPARAALLTGRYGFRTGVGSNVPVHVDDGEFPGLPLSELTLPEMLGPSWRSAIFGKWHLASDVLGPDHPRQSGFGTHAGTLRNITGQQTYYAWQKTLDGQTTPVEAYATTDTTDDALAFVTTAIEPWFALVTYNAPHAPYHAPPRRLHSFALEGDPADSPVEHYKAAVEALDTEIGRLLEGVDLSRTLVVFLGDNGTPGEATTAPFNPNRAKLSPYEGGVNVPLIVAGAGVSARGEVPYGLVGITDLFASLAKLAGRPAHAEDSISLVPYLSDARRGSLRPWVYTERFAPNRPGVGGFYIFRQRAIRGERYKLIVSDGNERLYDLLDDPFEADDLLSGVLSPREELELASLRTRMESISGP